MKTRPVLRLTFALLLASLAVPVFSQAPAITPKKTSASSGTPHKRAMCLVCAACVRAHEEFLASDAMQGRGSATHDEWLAAVYVGSELRQYGIEPAGDDGGYL